MNPLARPEPMRAAGVGHDDAPPRRRPRLRARRVALVAVVFAAGVALASELLLPSLAERRLRDGLSERGAGVRVSITARPGLKLLIGHADAVRVHAARLTSDGGRSGNLLARTGRAGRVDAVVDRLRSHGLLLRDVELHEDHGRLTARASVTRAAIRSALPAAVTLEPAAASGGGIRFAARARALGRTVRATAVVRVRDGRIVMAPDSFAGALLQVTLFADPRVVVDRVAIHGTDPLTFTAAGHLR